VKARQEQLAANVRKAWNVLDTGNKNGTQITEAREKRLTFRSFSVEL